MSIAIPVLPESAPFTPAQRSWLNGFLAGLLGQAPGATGATGAPGLSAAGGASAAVAAPDADEEFAWHDPALSLTERMELARDKPIARRMMAAMAQLDCGACGYLCKTYSQAIADGTEKDLTRCAPGGRDTSKKLKELAKELSSAPAPAKAGAAGSAMGPIKGGKFGRHNPFPAELLKSEPLNQAGSMKDTRLVCLDLKGSGLNYKVGDALGVVPENDPDMVGWIIEALDATGAEEVIEPAGKRVPLHEALGRHYSLGRPSDLMLELLVNAASDPGESSALKELLAGDGPGEGDEILDLLRQFPSARPEPYEFVSALNPLQPRLYSISSSLRSHPEQVHLTVGVVRYLNGRGRQCKGVCSTFFAERSKPGIKTRVFVHPSHAFGLPEDGNTPIIMVGPGTGIAPFRAFLQERKSAGARGKNWLFFGDQQQASDFLYRAELEAYAADGFLTRLDTAFSRDQKKKVYVQDRMMDSAAELWRWLQEGAHFYVCGDAKRMAADVDATLRQVVATHGGMSADAARAYVADLSAKKRYQRDVY